MHAKPSWMENIIILVFAIQYKSERIINFSRKQNQQNQQHGKRNSARKLNCIKIYNKHEQMKKQNDTEI